MTESKPFIPLSRFKTAESFAKHWNALTQSLFGERLGCDERILAAPDSPLASPVKIGEFRVGNRFCIHPMEGWDASRDGRPTEWTTRRWRNFGLSGAKLIWGGEAVAVVENGRANPHQLYYRPENEKGLASLLQTTLNAHREKFGSTDDLMIGLQLTHSGRFCRPHEHDRLIPRIAHRHPALDTRFGVESEEAILTDMELDDLIHAYVTAATAAAKLGYHFVDIKHCHGYLLHELLGAKTRSGNYGGSFENRTRFLREVVRGIRRDAPGLAVGIRLSMFDDAGDLNDFHFSPVGDDPAKWDLSETFQFLELARELGAISINLTAGSPYYSAAIQRPAAFPPVDSREMHGDPLNHVARQLHAARLCKRAVPSMPMIGTAYSYFQEYLPNVAQAQVRLGNTDLIGLGRVVLSYPDLPTDILAGRESDRRKVCRTFSDCTNGPRMGFISGCYPLDPVYKNLPEWEQIRAKKKGNPA